MAVIDFPNSPTKGDYHQQGSETYVYTGAKWEIANTSSSLHYQQVFNAANAANTLDVGNTLANTYYLTQTTDRTRLNFVPGSGITINVDDYSAQDAANVAIAPVSSFITAALLREPQVYTTLGASTWSKPTGLAFIIVEVQGGGGGGSGAGTGGTQTSGRGGGAGGYARRAIAAASLGSTETVTVGSGGAGGTSGGGAAAAGGASSFGTTTFLTGCGGAAGGSPVGLAGGLGGSGGLATSGDINSQGGDGGSAGHGGSVVSGAISARARWAGEGGVSFFGGGGGGGRMGNTGGAPAGLPGKAYGSGGGGGMGNSGGTGAGGAGKQGIVIVWEFA